jgi:hypothetical protein
MRGETVGAGVRSATATAIFSPSLAPIVPAPSAPNAPHMLFKAAGELATARNMFGAVPKAPLISSSSGFAAPVAVVGSTRFTLGMDVSFALKKAVGLRTRTPVLERPSASSSRRASPDGHRPAPGRKALARMIRPHGDRPKECHARTAWRGRGVMKAFQLRAISGAPACPCSAQSRRSARLPKGASTNAQ